MRRRRALLFAALFAGPLPQAPTKVRLLLIDTPEVFGRQECFGEQASRRAEQLLPPGSQVRVQADRDLLDRHGRTLLQIWTTDGVNVAQVLLAEGFATVLVVRPNVAYLQQFLRAEQAAHEADAGLWATCR